MTILRPITTVQYFDVTQRLRPFDDIPKANRLVVIDEETKISRTITITSTTSWEWYDRCLVTINPALKDGHTYEMKLIHTDDSIVRYRGKMFVTSQAVNTTRVNDVRGYSVNDGRYTENTTTNEFILNE
jgi:hypothetical protein